MSATIPDTYTLTPKKDSSIQLRDCGDGVLILESPLDVDRLILRKEDLPALRAQIDEVLAQS